MLQQELWIAQLGAYSHTDSDTALVLQQALARQIVSRLDKGEVIRQGGVATWYTQFEREYVARLDDGRRFLVPPAVRLCLDILPKNALNDDEVLINALVELTGFTFEAVNRWYRAIPCLMSDWLGRGVCVCMTDLGTFSPDADCGIIFDPAQSLNDKLNRAFSSFSPTLLAHETPIPHTEERRICDENSISQLVIRMSLPINTTSQESLEEQEESGESLEKKDACIKNSTIDLPSEGTAAIPLQEISQEDMEEDIPRSVDRHRKWSCWWIVVILLVVAQLSFLFWAFSPTLSDKTRKKLSNDQLKPLGCNYQDSLKKEQAVKRDNSDIEDFNSYQLRTSEACSTGIIGDEEKLQWDNKLAKTVPQKIKPDQIQANTKTEIKIRIGDRLTKIARQKYGHKAFWVYIYQENKDRLHSPDILPEGALLTLPPAAKYAIDASDNNSIARALALQHEINSKQ